MREFIDVFLSRQDILWEALLEHLQISLISLMIAIFIAVPLGLYLTRHKKIAEPIIGMSAVMQTIPSLAVLAFLIPFFGIGKLPAIIALTAYGLLPILRNTYTGVNEVDGALKMAARGMGMNSFRRLTRVELPIATPVIMAGIRTSMVLIVGTTTIAALIGAGGLGELILLGIDRGGDLNLIILGAIPAALLAIFLDYILRAFEKISYKLGLKSFVALILASILIVLAPFFIHPKDNSDIVIGGKLGAEPTILINMYKLLIEDETDLDVELKSGFGKTLFTFNALQEGSIDIYPEFTGTAIVSLLEEEAESNDPKEVYKQARTGMNETFDMALLKPMQYNNTYAVALKKEFANKYKLETIGDLRRVEDDITAGFTLEFKDRNDGYKGMQELYGVNIPHIKTMEPGIRQKAIENGEIDVIDAYATSSYMIELNLITLDDPKHLFPPYQGAPLMRTETLDKYPELRDILNQLAGKVTDEQMQNMNYKVDYLDESAHDVAKQFLIEQGLLQK